MYFTKVPFEEYCKSFRAELVKDENYIAWLRMEWDAIKLPTRATGGSAGYDFYLPTDVNFKCNGDPVIIPTGIRVKIDPGFFLMLLPRSGMGFKYGMQLENTAGIIDEDYFNADNYGHIMAKISISSRNEEDLLMQAGERFMQGIFMPYGLVSGDVPRNQVRRGGFGSTGA